MSSRKRRAASGSRKGPTPRRTTPEASALREARHLVAPGTDRLTAETWASIHLGSTWASASPKEPRPEEQLVLELVAEARRRPSPAAAAALVAVRLVVPHPEIDAALADLGQPVPAWATGAAPVPVRVWRTGDPWRSQETWFVDYGDHLLVESVSHPGGTLVRELSVADRGVLRRYDAMLKGGGETLGSRVEVPLEEALREMRAALRVTELTWPREPSDSYAEHRLLALARLGTAYEDRAVSDQERERLRADLLGADPSPVQRRLTGLILDYAYGHLHHPLRWSPEEALLFLLDWAPRNAALDDAERRALPGLLERWVVLALTQAGIETRWHEPVIEAVRQGAAAFAQLYDETSAGPARQLAAALDASGVDRDDDEAVQAVIREWNATRLARTALLTHDVPAGVAVRLTITLLDVSPPIWRRLVVPADVTLDRLSRLVQAAMGWDGGHLHEWYRPARRTARRGGMCSTSARHSWPVCRRAPTGWPTSTTWATRGGTRWSWTRCSCPTRPGRCLAWRPVGGPVLRRTSVAGRGTSGCWPVIANRRSWSRATSSSTPSGSTSRCSTGTSVSSEAVPELLACVQLPGGPFSGDMVRV